MEKLTLHASELVGKDEPRIRIYAPAFLQGIHERVRARDRPLLEVLRSESEIGLRRDSECLGLKIDITPRCMGDLSLAPEYKKN
jgi:hypothetical protein